MPKASLTAVFLCVLLVGAAWSRPQTPTPAAKESLYTQYTDPQRRFVFDYPATMKVRSSSADEVQIYHPGASFRISVFLETRKSKTPWTSEDLLGVLIAELKKEMKDVNVLGQGKLAGLSGSQGYVIVAFTDKKGSQHVELVQYYVTQNRVFRMIISDRPLGFKNLETVIQRVHHSLRIIDPKLGQ
jgi:hypothetical protein